MDVLSALNAFLYTQKTPTQSSNLSSSNFVSWRFPWSPVTPTQAQVILSSAGPPGTLNLNHCTGHGQCCLHGCLFRSPASNPWQAVGALCFVTGDELGHQIVWWAEVESNPPACLWNMTTMAEWEELNLSQEEIQSIYTCSSFITKYDGQKIRYFLYRRLKQNERVKIRFNILRKQEIKS